MRQTSISAYKKIKENGLLSKRRWQVYDYIYHNGPSSCREVVNAISKSLGQNVSVTYSSFSSRFSELKKLGCLIEVGQKTDLETNNKVTVWAVTDRLPQKLDKQLTSKQKLNIAENILKENNLFEEFEKRLNEKTSK